MKPHDAQTLKFRDKFGTSLLLTALCLMLAGCISKVETPHHVKTRVQVARNAININAATVIELQKLPFVGAKTAEEIVLHRTKYGRFRRPEHLILVKGISDKRFRDMRNMIKIE